MTEDEAKDHIIENILLPGLASKTPDELNAGCQNVRAMGGKFAALADFFQGLITQEQLAERLADYEPGSNVPASWVR